MTGLIFQKRDFMGNTTSQQLLSHLYECLRREVMMSDKTFSWGRTLHKAIKCPARRYHFWWRIASWLYHSGSGMKRRLARRIQRNLVLKYGTEIQLGAAIGPGMVISHHYGIVINGAAVIGHSFRIRQNVTIGIAGSPVNSTTNKPRIIIGDNVCVGANSCIISDNILIGNNVTIGAMSFINKDIPDNHTVFTEKTIRSYVIPSEGTSAVIFDTAPSENG